MNLFILKHLIPGNIFEVKSLKFAIGMLLIGLFYINAALFIVFFCTAFVIDEMNVLDNALGGIVLKFRGAHIAVIKHWIYWLVYPQTSNISHTLVGNKMVDLSDVVGVPPVGTTPIASPFLT